MKTFRSVIMLGFLAGAYGCTDDSGGETSPGTSTSSGSSTSGEAETGRTETTLSGTAGASTSTSTGSDDTSSTGSMASTSGVASTGTGDTGNTEETGATDGGDAEVLYENGEFGVIPNEVSGEWLVGWWEGTLVNANQALSISLDGDGEAAVEELQLVLRPIPEGLVGDPVPADIVVSLHENAVDVPGEVLFSGTTHVDQQAWYTVSVPSVVLQRGETYWVSLAAADETGLFGWMFSDVDMNGDIAHSDGQVEVQWMNDSQHPEGLLRLLGDADSSD